MVGKPNLPTPEPSFLDQEREASMADEGGAAGALMESQDGAPPLKTSLRSLAQIRDENQVGRSGTAGFAALLATAAALGYFVGRRRSRA